MKDLRKFIATTIHEYLDEQQELEKDDYKIINKLFNNKLGKLIDYGKYSFVFEYGYDKVIKIKNNDNSSYNDYGFYKTYKIGNFRFNKNVLTINGKYLTVYNDTLYYVIMEKLIITKEIVNDIDDLEFEIKQFTGDIKIPPLLWLYNNIDNDKILVDFINKINNKNVFSTLSEILPLLVEIKKRGIDWRDIHKGNFGYNKNGKLVPFDLEY